MYHWGHWKDSICHTKSPSCPQPLKSPAPLTCSFINGLALTTDPNCLWTALHVLLVSACPGSCQQATACIGCAHCLCWRDIRIIVLLWGAWGSLGVKQKAKDLSVSSLKYLNVDLCCMCIKFVQWLTGTLKQLCSTPLRHKCKRWLEFALTVRKR